MPHHPPEPEPVPPSVTRRVLIGAAAGASAGLVAVLTGFVGVFTARHEPDADLPAAAATTPGASVPPSTPAAAPTSAGVATSNPPPAAGAPPARNPPPVRTQSPKPPPTRPAGRLIAKVDDVPVGGGIVLTSEVVVVTQPASGQFGAFSARCTHQGCVVADVEAGDIVCGCHGSRFSIQDGSVHRGPAQSPLARRTVNVDGGNIYLV